MGYPSLCTVCWLGVGYPTYAILLILRRGLPNLCIFVDFKAWATQFIYFCWFKINKSGSPHLKINKNAKKGSPRLINKQYIRRGSPRLKINKSGSPRLGTTSVGRTVCFFSELKVKNKLLINWLKRAQEEIPEKSWKASFNIESTLKVGIETWRLLSRHSIPGFFWNFVLSVLQLNSVFIN